jgi:hypothetical protein
MYTLLIGLPMTFDVRRLAIKQAAINPAEKNHKKLKEDQAAQISQHSNTGCPYEPARPG